MSAQDSQPFHWHYTELDDRSFQIHGRTLFFTIVLFSLVLLVLLLFLYARWICRLHSLPSSLPTTTTSHASPATPPPPQPRGLDPAAINALPVLLHRPLEGTECCICLAVFEDGEKVKVLPQCRHCYHCECVDRWLTTQSSCPLCRASLRVESALPPSMSVVTE